MNFESSYLQIGIDFGAVGMAIVMAILLRNLWIEFGILQRSNSPMAALPFVLTLYLIFSSFSDIYLALHNCYIPFLLFYIYAIGRRERAQARLWRPDPRLGWAAARGALSLNRYS
jgi:O-antigen ligase